MALKERLNEFVGWWRQHVTGDERGEAQIFLDHFFESLGHSGGCRAAGGTLEERIRGGRGRAVRFADYVWKPVVLIEMKRRGTDLRRHYEQAFAYWTRLVPNRPRYVVLCNFDEFWVYDFETQVDDPIDKLRVEDLPTRPGPILFLLPKPETPVFGNDQEAVTREAADLLATCFRSLQQRIGQPIAQRFTLQMLVALFAEDIGLLEQYFVTRLLDECSRPEDSYDLLGNLFAAMAERGRTPGGRYRGVDYFNGGLFAEPARVELISEELELLRSAAAKRWSQVRPEIFGTIFPRCHDSC
ncbi:MAG: class I SAM-dependent DNA methyltransferase, partial [Proteobacteria bacterium]|nr:class I SAM-dependent DNA methyltransferase [Pseudomonadota bacterium]